MPMDEIKKILSKVTLLAIDIFLFAFNTIRQVILPGKRKKGNLLSSLFMFFVGLIERLDSFEYGVFRMANLLKQKYIRRSLLIIAGLLFLLSSFEWTGEKNVNNSAGNYTVQFSEAASVKNGVVGNRRFISAYSKTVVLFRADPSYKNILQSSFSTIFSSVKTFILIRSIRI
jgi:hypothetical protein